MTKQIYILLIVVFGFLLTPTPTYACGKSHTKTEKTCCDKKTSQTKKNDCCKKEHSQSNHDNDGCGGKCGHSSCHCSGVNIAIALPFVSELKHTISFSEKQSILYTETYISSGFRSIWLPPKIS